MKIVIVNKSDSTGGAAVVSFRLMMALRSVGVDARMLVAEKLTDSRYVEVAASGWRLKTTFLADRMKIAFANGFDRRTLFKLDAAAAGINISRHPLVREADAIFLNWINQGLLSLKDIDRIGKLGKKIVWTMHDMWNLTGICHHAGGCRRFVTPGACGFCPLLGKYGSSKDLSYITHRKKSTLYNNIGIKFVAVSSWLARNAAESSLLSDQRVTVIPNAFNLPDRRNISRTEDPDKIRLIFGAARLDDEIKGFPVFIEAIKVIKERYPELASKISIILYGYIRNEALIDEIPLPVEYVGMLRKERDVIALYCRSDIVVSTSLFETLPGTLVEGQAYGCFPVTFGRGGQRDIVDDGETGLIVDWDEDSHKRALAIAYGISKAARKLSEDALSIRHRMYDSVKTRFDSSSIANAYLRLLE